ncbi:hypothetical protein BCM32_00260, partial [Helicobacter winghamensis]
MKHWNPFVKIIAKYDRIMILKAVCAKLVYKVSKMKILLVIDDVSIFGGVERVVANLANAFLEQGDEVCVYSLFCKSQSLPYEYPNIVFHSHTSTIDLKKPKNKMGKILREILRIFVQPVNALIECKNAWSFKKFINEYQPNFILCNEWTNALVKTLAKMPNSVKVVHCSFDAYLQCGLELAGFKNVALLTFQEIEQFQAKYPSSNFYVIPNFLPNIPNAQTDYTQKVVLSVGRMSLDNQKGFLRLLEIWNLIMRDSAFKEWKLHIVGGGELKPQIEARIKELKLSDSIKLKPFTKEVEKEYLSASIYAMSSHFEGLPMVLLEASSYGLQSL